MELKHAAVSHYSQALAFLQKGDQRSALAGIEQAVALYPGFVDAWFLRGNVLQLGRCLQEAVDSYQRAIQLRPAFPEAFNNLAAAQRAMRHFPQALASVNQALTLRPAYPKALNNRGLILLDGRHGSAAVDDFRRALGLEPQFTEAWHNLGLALMQLRRFAEAGEAYAQLAALAPNFPHVAGDLLTAKLSICDWTDIDACVQGIIAAVQRGEPAAVPLIFLYACGSAALQQRCAQIYAAAHFPAHTQTRASRQAGTHRDPRRKIRVAYLSGDLGEHPVTYLLAGVFERHDSEHFETIALSWDRAGEPIRRRVEAAFSRFVDITAMEDAAVARLMQRLEIDIAVDLTGHTLGQRTGILARRPAPIQVNFLGLPATMGAPYMDYLIADRFVIPEEHRRHYSEKIVWLPDSYLPNDDRRALPTGGLERGAFGLPETGLVLASFNKNSKMNPACFDVWMRALNALPGSVLWLLASHPDAESNLRREAVLRHVDAARLVFAADVPYADYLARYTLVDLVLDTAPFNGGTTVSDALSMGVPVVTIAGESFAARMAGGLLTSLGLSDLVTHSLRDYEAVVMKLTAHPDRLVNLRRELALRRTHAFFDTDRYRHHLEAAYRTMWERYEAGLPPAAFAVAARAG